MDNFYTGYYISKLLTYLTNNLLSSIENFYVCLIQVEDIYGVVTMEVEASWWTKPYIFICVPIGCIGSNFRFQENLMMN